MNTRINQEKYTCHCPARQISKMDGLLGESISSLPYREVPGGPPEKYMTKLKKPLRLKDIVELLANPCFRADSRTFWAHYRTHSDKIGEDKVEWEREAPAFINSYLDPFIQKWGGAYPASDELLSSPIWQETNDAQLTGRWGIIPVYPWTTKKDVTDQLKNIQQKIGKKRIEIEAIRKAQIARWLQDCFISTDAGVPPRRSTTAAAVWGRKKGLTRLRLESAVQKMSEHRETELLRRYQKKGYSYRQAMQHVYKAARGKEAPAAAMVRMALRRHPAKQLGQKSKMTELRNTDKIGLAMSMLLRELPTSKSSAPNLDAIRFRAVELGNLFLPPESPA